MCTLCDTLTDVQHCTGQTWLGSPCNQLVNLHDWERNWGLCGQCFADKELPQVATKHQGRGQVRKIPPSVCADVAGHQPTGADA